MAGIRASVTNGEVATGTSLKTMLQLVAASNHRVKVNEWSVGFAGLSSTQKPVLVELVRQTSAGTMSSATPEKLNASDDETLQTTAQKTATVEPAGTEVLESVLVHPQAGYTWQAQLGNELLVGGGGRLGLRVTSDNDIECNATFKFEE